MIAAFTVVSRVATTFAPLYLMKQGLRASLLPAIKSRTDQRVFAGGDPDRCCAAGHIQTQTAECGLVRVRDSGGAEHLP